MRGLQRGLHGEVSAELRFAGPFLNVNSPVACLSLGWEALGMRSQTSACCLRLWVCLFLAYSHLWLVFVVLASVQALILNLPRFTACLFNCTHISEDFAGSAESIFLFTCIDNLVPEK